MYEVRIRQVMLEDGEACGEDGCPVAQGEDLVVLSVNGTQLLEMSDSCAVVVGDSLMAEARHVDLRRQRRQVGGSERCGEGAVAKEVAVTRFEGYKLVTKEELDELMRLGAWKALAVAVVGAAAGVILSAILITIVLVAS